MIPKLNHEADRLREQVRRLQAEAPKPEPENPRRAKFIVLDPSLDPDPYGLHGFSADYRIACMEVEL